MQIATWRWVCVTMGLKERMMTNNQNPTYTRDELLAALSVVSQFLKGLPGSMTLTIDQLQDTQPVTTLGDSMPGLPAPASLKGLPQPPRKHYLPVARTKRGSTDDLPRAARRIADLVLASDAPLTSHDIMGQLQMARPTFNNAMSILLRRRIVQAIPVRTQG